VRRLHAPIDRIGGCTDLWGLADVLRSPVDEHDRNRREGCKNQVVAAPQCTRFGRLARTEGRSAPDAARADLEQPAEGEGYRKSCHRRPEQSPDRGVRDVESREHYVRDLQHEPSAYDVQRARAEDLAAARLAKESNDSLHDAVQGRGFGMPRLRDILQAAGQPRPAVARPRLARDQLPEPSRPFARSCSTIAAAACSALARVVSR